MQSLEARVKQQREEVQRKNRQISAMKHAYEEMVCHVIVLFVSLCLKHLTLVTLGIEAQGAVVENRSVRREAQAIRE